MKDIPSDQLALMDANFERNRKAAARDVERAGEAIEAISAVPVAELSPTEVALRQKYLQVLRLRVGHPHATLLQLGSKMYPRVSKDTYAARLRRAFAFADKMKERI